jgi:hypothetical protein
MNNQLDMFSSANMPTAAVLNTIMYEYYYNYLKELAINAFEWEGLPDTCDVRIMELALMMFGMCVFFEDEVLGHLTLETMIAGNLDIYKVPKIRTAYSNNGYNKMLTDEDSVIIFNNYLRQPYHQYISMFAYRLANMDRTIDVNVTLQKTPWIIKCYESQKNSVKNMFKQYKDNEPLILATKDIDLATADKIDIKSEFIADKVEDEKAKIWSQALTFLGIENVSSEKAERLVANEVSAAHGAVEMSRYNRLNARRDAANKINKMFGLNITVNYRADVGQFNAESNTTARKLETEIMEAAGAKGGFGGAE